MKLVLSGTCLSDFRLFVRSNIPGLPVHSLLTASHAKPAQTSTVPRWVMTECQPSGPFATLEPSTAVDPKQPVVAGENISRPRSRADDPVSVIRRKASGGLRRTVTLMAYGLWLMAYGLWLMAYGLWLMAYGLWLMAYGLWLMAYG